MKLALKDSTILDLTGAQGTTEYINGQSCPALRLIFDAAAYQDPQLRGTLADAAKTQTMTITGDDGAVGAPLEGYTVLVRSVYEGGQIKVVMAQSADAAEAELRAKAAAQEEALNIIMGGKDNA